MKLLIIISSLIVLTACSQVKFSPEACTVVSEQSGSLITCPDGSSQLVPNGQNGQTGSQGPTGQAGTNGTNGTNGSNGNGFNPGLSCDVYSINANDYNTSWDKLLSDGTMEFTATLANFNVPNQSDQTNFASFTSAQQALIGTANYALDCSGYINIPESAVYSFTLNSDDGSEMAIDNTILINMVDIQAMTGTTVNNVQLFAGLHKFNMLYYQGPHTNIGLQLYWSGPSNQSLGSSELVPSGAFSH